MFLGSSGLGVFLPSLGRFPTHGHRLPLDQLTFFLRDRAVEEREPNWHPPFAHHGRYHRAGRVGDAPSQTARPLPL